MKRALAGLVVALMMPLALRGDPPRMVEERALVRAADLVTVQHGTLPIIISAPHGGQVRVPGSKDRTRGVLVRDDATAEVALLVAQRITAKLGAKPSVVIAQFSRKDADANRAADSGEAYENDAARAPYDAYHSALRALVDECRAAGKPAILIDIHGQKREPEAIVRGTRDGATVRALLARGGQAALTGPESICGRLEAMGYRVLPAAAKPGEEAAGVTERHPMGEAFFDGGHIIAHYGSQNADGIDAMQLELGRMRATETVKTARDLGDAIAAFCRAYLRPEAGAGPGGTPNEPAAEP